MLALDYKALKLYKSSKTDTKPDYPNGTKDRQGFISRSQIKLENLIGEGTFGDIYKGTVISKNSYEKPLKIPVAIKKSKNNESAKSLEEEAELLKGLSHPHIIRLIGVCLDDSLWMVLELSKFGDLRRHFDDYKQMIGLLTLVSFINQICSALTYLESLKIIHRDIAARNILVFPNEIVKLCDFGMSKSVRETGEYYSEIGGMQPIKWMAPESRKERKFTTASDVWMFGICCWEILSYGKKPFSGLSNTEAIVLIDQGKRLPQPKICPKVLYDIILDCWIHEANLRPTFTALHTKFIDIHENLRIENESRNSYATESVVTSTDDNSNNYGSPNETLSMRKKNNGLQGSLSDEVSSKMNSDESSFESNRPENIQSVYIDSSLYDGSLCVQRKNPNILYSKIYKATSNVISTVHAAGDDFVVKPPKTFPIILKSMCSATRDLFMSIQEVEPDCLNDKQICDLHEQINGTIKEIHSLNEEAMKYRADVLQLEDCRKRLMIKSYRMVELAHNLCNEVVDYRA